MVDALPLARRSLGFFPTPLVELRRLSHVLGGPRIWMKRDDQTGLALGGNKTRKLEYLVGDALARGADTLITGGAAQSNHCRQTAAAAAACGLECHLVLGGGPGDVATGNLLLDELLGAQLHWTGPHRKGEDIPRIAEALRDAGRTPYVVPYGGSSAVGATGFVEAVRELGDQLRDADLRFGQVVFASSSAGTHAGLLVGRHCHAQDFGLLGIQVDKDDADALPLARRVRELADATAAHLGLRVRFDEDEVRLDDGRAGAGYGVVGEAEREAIRLVAQTEGVLLDPVYTGRAMAGLIERVRRGALPRDAPVLFWHTGGAPALFAYARDLLPGAR